MANILIYTEGTLGDHLPYIALGQALSACGHRVRFAINKAMHKYAQLSGLEAVALTDTERGPEEARKNAWAWDHWHQVDLDSCYRAEPLAQDHYVTRARELIELCHDADLLIATSIRTLGYVAHAATGIPWLTASMNPYSFWQPVSLEEREAWLQGRLQEYENLKGLLAHTFAQLGLDHPVPNFSKAWLYARHVILASGW
ncbi:MAG TPA: hypothetical protein VHS28_09125, partial [Chloroflexota bacterium]|nr:hypothetical protein [Chloroflexota bacterium]